MTISTPHDYVALRSHRMAYCSWRCLHSRFAELNQSLLAVLSLALYNHCSHVESFAIQASCGYFWHEVSVGACCDVHSYVCLLCSCNACSILHMIVEVALALFISSFRGLGCVMAVVICHRSVTRSVSPSSTSLFRYL